MAIVIIAVHGLRPKNLATDLSPPVNNNLKIILKWVTMANDNLVNFTYDNCLRLLSLFC